MRPALFLTLALITAACEQFPELDAAVGPDAMRAPYPELAPTAKPTEHTGIEPPDFSAGLNARAAALRQRAEILRQPLTDESALDRMRLRLANTVR